MGVNQMDTVKQTCLFVALVAALTFSGLILHYAHGINAITATKISEAVR